MDEEEKILTGKVCPICGENRYLRTYDSRREFMCCGCGYLTGELNEII